MKTVNIYCGIRSIGWNVAEDGLVVDYGVKRVNVDFDSYYAYVAGLPVAKRIDRRMKRSMRRNLWRYKTRREKLKKLLVSDGMYPGDELLGLDRVSLNSLRGRAYVGEKLTREQVGRVLMDIQRKRGYKSMRGVDDTGDSEYLKEIEQHETTRQDYASVGDYLNSLPSNKNVILRRETYEAEYLGICEQQGIDAERYYGAIFRQRPLKKGKIAFCVCERNRKVTHQSNPIYQRFRVLRDVNSIELFDAENNEVEITGEHRAMWIDYLWSGKDLTKAGALKMMGIKKPSLYKWYMGKSIAGNVWANILGEKEYHPIPNAYVNDVWQDLLSATDDYKLQGILKRKYSFDDESAQALVEYDVKGMGFSDYSVKAIKKLIPELAVGNTLREALLNVYGKVDFEGGAHLRNVVLEQVHASADSLVKALKAKHGDFELQIEIDSLLKMGNKARKARATNTRKQERINVELNVRIAEAGGEVSEYNRKKLRLWDESGGVCPYFPDVKIAIEELFTEKYNLDHIVPKSKLFEFSEDNLVIMPARENSEKLRRTGVDYVASAGDMGVYVEYVNNAKISERKRNLLLMREDDIPTDYVSRGAGTDYNSRCFLALNKVSRCIPNKLINMYSKSWYGNPYDENDVRNVLVKSFTMANFDKTTIDYFDNLKTNSAGVPSAGVYALQQEIALPDLTAVPVFCPKTKYFRKTKYGYTSRFSLHKESVYGQRMRIVRNAKGELKKEVYYKIRQPLTKLSPKMAGNISDLAIRRLFANHLSKYKSHQEAMDALADTPLKFNGKPIRAVSVNVNGSLLVPLHSADGKGRTGKLSEFDNKVDYVYSSMNYSVNVVDGRRVTVPLIRALQSLNEGSFSNKGLHKGDSVFYEGKQYIISGIDDSKIALRSAYTLLAENAMNMSRAGDIEKLEVVRWGQVKRI